MAYSIPPYRLPRKILKAEIDQIRQMGVEIKTQAPIKDGELLTQGYDAVLISTGAWEPAFLGGSGPRSQRRSSRLSVSGKEQHRRTEKRKRLKSPARGLLWWEEATWRWMLPSLQPGSGAKRTHLIYRRSFEEMPAIRSEDQLGQRARGDVLDSVGPEANPQRRSKAGERDRMPRGEVGKPGQIGEEEDPFR